jgi:predicted O-linked N-acetylglucosamine transferase (SPINDLY family)
VVVEFDLSKVNRGVPIVPMAGDQARSHHQPMATISEALAIALGHHQAGRLDAAEQIYQRILQVEREQPDALHFLGVLTAQLGRHQAAADYIRRAIAVNPHVAPYHLNLGRVYQEWRKPDEAIASYQRALQLQPDFVEVHFNLGTAFKEHGQIAEAVECFRRALALKPDFAEAHYNLGKVLLGQKERDEAIACFRRTLALKPDFAEAYHDLGLALKDQGSPDEVVECFRRTLALKPDFAEAHNNLGLALQYQGNVDEAVACFGRALALRPDFFEAVSNQGFALQYLGKLDEAVACYRRALEGNPELVGALSNLGTALAYQGKLDEAVECYRRALQLKPDYPETHSNLLFTLQYRAGTTLAELAAAHAEYDRLHAGPLRAAWRPHENVRDPQRPLRLGFVSPDFGRNPVGYFLIRALENLDPSQWQTVCYCYRVNNDELTARFQAAATLWRDVRGLSQERLAERIRADRIDILFDLAGHAGRNRLLAFARKPSPIQVTWAGYVGTTGLTAMDYILADRYEIPPRFDGYYCEKVLRMPDGYVCYDPPGYAPPVSPLPALKRGYATFGCFNNPAKIGGRVVEVWAEVLRRLPQSRLVLKYKGINDPSIAGPLASQFAARGIDPGRLEFLGRSPHAELLQQYQSVDVALDPFPYNGGLTTCEALWMGVPVITLPGETFASRHSLSHLSNVGLTETIAGTLEEYVELAVSWAADLPRLAALRSALRERMAASPLCNGRRFAANLAAVLRDRWQRWIAEGQH